MNHGVLPYQGIREGQLFDFIQTAGVSSVRGGRLRRAGQPTLCGAGDGQTGAHAASRVAAQRREALGRCLPSSPKTPAEGKEWQHSLQETLETDLNAFVQEHRLTEGSSRIVGSMQRLLPTTLCMALYDMGERACFLWAGDSRGYVLDEDGLHLYTRDDVKFRMDELGTPALRCAAELVRQRRPAGAASSAFGYTPAEGAADLCHGRGIGVVLAPWSWRRKSFWLR